MSNNAFRALTVLVLLVIFSSALLLAIGAPVMLAAVGSPVSNPVDPFWLWIIAAVSFVAMLDRMGVL